MPRHEKSWGETITDSGAIVLILMFVFAMVAALTISVDKTAENAVSIESQEG